MVNHCFIFHGTQASVRSGGRGLTFNKWSVLLRKCCQYSLRNQVPTGEAAPSVQFCEKLNIFNASGKSTASFL